jgi:glycosyltransferase involved in cell wall biosynthesis
MCVSVLIMTLNEEVNLPACLESLSWCDDIVILDSGSTDRTVEIAKAYGARVVTRAYDNEAGQRNFGLRDISYKHRWLYIPDADEITPADLRDEMLTIAQDPSRPESFFRARYKNMFMGQWIRHSSLYPTWIPRLVNIERVRFERSVHMRVVGDGPEGRLQAHFVHYSFNKGLTAWYEKHNKYSGVEAKLSLSNQRQKEVPWTDLFAQAPEVRRRAVKQLALRLPFRPTLRFIYMYVLRGGFRDGWAGYTYCRLLAAYEYMIVVKTAELQRRERGLSV